MASKENFFRKYFTNQGKYPKEMDFYIKRMWQIYAGLIAVILLFFILLSAGVFGEMPSFEDLENPKSNLASQVISADGKVLGTYYIQNRSNIHFNELSPYLIQALIATEDARFEKHAGIDYKALLRVSAGVLTGRYAGGGSTITQQLAKNLFPRGQNLSTPAFVLKKFKEWVTAVKLERNYTK